MLLLIIAFLGTFGLIASAGLLLFYRDTVWQRLSRPVDHRRPSPRLGASSTGRKARVEQIVRPFQNVLPRSAREVSVLQRRLIRAGYRQESAVNIFYGAKAFLPLALMVAGDDHWCLPLQSRTGAAGCRRGWGSCIPDLWLGNRITNRKLNISLGLPEALDLMVVCTEAGLSIDQTLQRVSRELRVSQPEVADELGLAVLEQKAGKPREDTLKDMAERTNVPSVRAFVNTLVQSDVVRHQHRKDPAESTPMACGPNGGRKWKKKRPRPR